MTRDEIINGLYRGDGKAIKEAIKALKQEPCEDAISRRAVLNTLDKMDSVLDEGRTVETYKELLTACYKDLPSVTPTRKKGKWITNSDFPDEIICLCCNTNYDMWFWEQGTMKYCPNCGAEMEGEE